MQSHKDSTDKLMTRCHLTWNVNADSELQLRLRPLREHWEARGPGMLRFVRKTLPWLALPPQMEIQLVRPRQGGNGRVILPTLIEFGAILANPHPELPEIVRLAWLILCSTTNAANEQRAFVPVILAAADFVELAKCDRATMELALKSWIDENTATRTNDLHTWWQELDDQSRKTRENWTTAIEQNTRKP